MISPKLELKMKLKELHNSKIAEIRRHLDRAALINMKKDSKSYTKKATLFACLLASVYIYLTFVEEYSSDILLWLLAFWYIGRREGVISTSAKLYDVMFNTYKNKYEIKDEDAS
jgi:hypothetical protein